MLKENKWRLIVSSVLILLPGLVGLILWNRLSESVPIHWGMDGSPDGWGSRAMAVFLLPCMLLLIHWIGILVTAKDPGNRNQSRKAFGMVFWICPVISIFVCGMAYGAAMGRSLDTETLMPAILGLMFVVFGNMLPKCRRNRTIGIKIKWALENDENWNATHRLGGRLWVAGGLLLMACVFLPESVIPWAAVIALVVLAVIPVVYSYLFYRRQMREGTAVQIKTDRKRQIVNRIMMAVTAILLFVLLFTGEIRVTCWDGGVLVDATFYSDVVINYERLEKIEYRETCDPGTRANGFGSPRLLMGVFENEEFGYYFRYSYTKCDSCVLLTVNDDIYAIGCKTPEETEALYNQIAKKVK